MIIQKPFYYIRHGQTDWNLEGRFQGRMDIPLNETGVTQANAAKGLLADLPITQIFASPLRRARRTADIINEKLQLQITEIDDLQECNFGELEGQLRSDENYSEKWMNGATPDKAETYIDFTSRVFGAINSVLENDGTPLIVAHGAVYWPLRAHMQLDPIKDLPNARPVHFTPPVDGQGNWTKTEV